MSAVDQWLAGEGPLDLDDPVVVGSLRQRFWRAEAEEFVENSGWPLADVDIDVLAEDLRKAEERRMND